MGIYFAFYWQAYDAPSPQSALERERERRSTAKTNDTMETHIQTYTPRRPLEKCDSYTLPVCVCVYLAYFLMMISTGQLTTSRETHMTIYLRGPPVTCESHDLASRACQVMWPIRTCLAFLLKEQLSMEREYRKAGVVEIWRSLPATSHKKAARYSAGSSPTPPQLEMSSTLNVLRYSALGLGVLFGLKNDWGLKSAAVKHQEQEAYNRKLELVEQAKKEYAKLHSKPRTSTEINLEDPNLDFGDVILKAVENLQA